MLVPTDYAADGTTEELFARIKLTMAEQTHLSDKDSALLTLWVFSTWFHDVLSLAPGLIVSGPAHEGDAILRALYALLSSDARGWDDWCCSERNSME